MPISQSSVLQLASHALATLWIGFGINAIVRPANALTFFEWNPPASKADADVLNGLLAVYGVRDIFMGLALYSAAVWGTKKSLGWTMIAASAVAFADGYICSVHGQGQWNHWGYAPILTVVGTLLTGGFD
ncbi:hypothetical protein CONLIGDRAFT_390539 [Coniochaeta ligniaria NRRL 30616]|uniref:Integral membrane protein n=1 Tax=Coniochaeta ligniaria NRRL 30616 TaxID=1408157 RepID=A0A1J7IMC1_9PEZI|nr:hypothetical protein CONLIGDRAFT_390539 [Coniochaeta ligniaria NRRL 30616]